MQTLSLSTFAGAGALFTGATTGQVDTGDWPLTASQQASACPSTSILECSQPVADHGYFEIQFDLSNPLWGVRQDFGTSLGGIELRQGIGHMVDKQNFAATNAACNGVACTPNDAAMPICVVGNCNNGGLYAANPCNWDTKYSQTGAACVVGAAGGTSYNCSLSTTCPGTVSGIGGVTFSFQRPIGSKDFCAAGNHFQQAFTDAGITGVTLNANCELNPPPGGWPAKVTAFGAGTTGSQTCSGSTPTANVCFIVRTTQPRKDLGEGVAQTICALFSPAFVAGGWTTLAGQPLSCAPFLQEIEVPITSVCAFTTSNTGTPNNCWGMLTAGFILVFPFDSSTYFGYNSQFATKTNVTCLDSRCDPTVVGDTSAGSTCTGNVLTDAPGNYYYACDPAYDSLSTLMEFANCLGVTGDPTPGAASPTFANCAGGAVAGTCGASSGCSAISAGYQALDYFGSHVFTVPIWSGIDKFPVHNCYDLGDQANPGLQAEFGGSASGLGSTTYVFDYLNAYCSQAGTAGFTPAGVYRAGLMDTASTVSPFKATTFWDFDVLAAVYDTLFNPNPMCNQNPPSGSGIGSCSTNLQTIDWMTTSHAFVCNAAVNIPCDQGHLGYTPPPGTGATLQLTLNPNMKWHDSGLAVTAWDVDWTFKNLNVTGAFQASSLTNVVGIQVWNPTKLDLNLKARGPFTDLFIGGITIMPGHTWSACGASTWNSQISSANVVGTSLVNAAQDNCVGTFNGFLPGTSTQACPSSSISSNGIPVGCIGKTAANVSYADATFDPITSGFLVGSGSWVCESTNAAFAPVGTVGTGCSADNTQSPALQLGAYTLTRMGCNIATGACVNPAGSAAPPPVGNGPDYFHSSGFLALYIWSGMSGCTIVSCSDTLKLSSINAGSSAIINHYKQGIGNPGGTGSNAVTALVKARINAFKGYSWLAYSNERSTGTLSPQPISCAPGYRQPGTTAANALCPATGSWSPSVMPGIGAGYSSTGAPILYQWGAGNTFGTVATPDPARTNGVYTQVHNNVYALVGAQWFTGGAAGSGCAGPIGTAASAYPNAAYDC